MHVLAVTHRHPASGRRMPTDVPAPREAVSGRTLSGMLLIGVLAVIAALLVLAAVVDRRARANGHSPGGVGSWYAVREARRDNRAGQAQRWLSNDNDWTAGHRRNVDPEAQRRREDGD